MGTIVPTIFLPAAWKDADVFGTMSAGGSG